MSTSKSCSTLASTVRASRWVWLTEGANVSESTPRAPATRAAFSGSISSGRSIGDHAEPLFHTVVNAAMRTSVSGTVSLAFEHVVAAGLERSTRFLDGGDANGVDGQVDGRCRRVPHAQEVVASRTRSA